MNANTTPPIRIAHDAYQWIAQEAKALLITGKIDERFTAGLRSAFEQLEAATRRADERAASK